MPIIYLGHTCEIIQGTQTDTLNKDHKEPQGSSLIPLTKHKFLILMTDCREAQNLRMGSHSPKKY